MGYWEMLDFPNPLPPSPSLVQFDCGMAVEWTCVIDFPNDNTNHYKNAYNNNKPFKVPTALSPSLCSSPCC